MEPKQSRDQCKYGENVLHHIQKFLRETTEREESKESKAKIYVDMKDCHTLRNTMQLTAHPLDLDSHDNNLLINIYSGEIAHDKCNVQNSVVIGSQELIEFVESLSNGFYATIQKKVVTMEVNGKKKGSLAGNDLYNTEIHICTHVSCVFWVSVKFHLKICFSMSSYQFLKKIPKK